MVRVKTSLKAQRYIFFSKALRYKGLYKNELAVQTLLELAEKTNIEELYIFAFEWGKQANLEEYIEQILAHEFRNPVLRDYIFLHTIRQNDDIEERRNMISDFLNHNPQNVFSPQLRLILMRVI